MIVSMGNRIEWWVGNGLIPRKKERKARCVDADRLLAINNTRAPMKTGVSNERRQFGFLWLKGDGSKTFLPVVAVENGVTPYFYDKFSHRLFPVRFDGSACGV